MTICPVCNGDGKLPSTDEVERSKGIEDSCYHCGESGEVDEETAYHDRLVSVASQLAQDVIRDMRNNPPEDGWCLLAAENGMTESDYFQCRGWELEDRYLPRIVAMTSEEQEFMMEINDPESWFGQALEANRLAAAIKNFKRKIVAPSIPVWSQNDSDIPF